MDQKRARGFSPGYDLYTMGVDVQHNGELYWTIGGWKSGRNPSFHVFDYGISRWRDITGCPNCYRIQEKIIVNDSFPRFTCECDCGNIIIVEKEEINEWTKTFNFLRAKGSQCRNNRNPGNRRAKYMRGPI